MFQVGFSFLDSDNINIYNQFYFIKGQIAMLTRLHYFLNIFLLYSRAKTSQS